MADLSGKVAVITGGNSGIGFATAREFKRLGAKVAITGRNGVLEAAKQLGEDVLGITADVTKLEDLDRLFAIARIADSDNTFNAVCGSLLACHTDPALGQLGFEGFGQSVVAVAGCAFEDV